MECNCKGLPAPYGSYMEPKKKSYYEQYSSPEQYAWLNSRNIPYGIITADGKYNGINNDPLGEVHYLQTFVNFILAANPEYLYVFVYVHS